MSALLLVNDVFEFNGTRRRLVHVAKHANAAYTVALGAPIDADPFRWNLTDLSDLASELANDKKPKLRVVTETSAIDRPVNAGRHDLIVRDLRWARIKDLVRHPGVWEQETRVALLAAHAKAIGVSTKTLRANLRMWWAGGQTPDALLGNSYRCGRIEASTPGALSFTETSPNGPVTVVFAPAKKNARGRRPKEGNYVPLALPPELRSTILEVARAHYEDDACKTVRGATTVVLTDLFSLKDADGKPLRDADDNAVLKPPGQRPSFHQVRYLLKRSLVISATYKRRHGAANYDNNHAPSTGSVLDDCLGPGDVYEIDATIIDVYVVATVNRRVIIGKPTLFLIIDRWSRLIVGFYISLENPSWSEATQAILSISGDWEALCKRLGVTYHERDWPARGVQPNRYFGDRADMITYASNALCDGVAVQVTNAPALMSKDKSLVESGFLTTSVPLREHVDGYEPPTNPFKRRAKKYHKDGALTFNETAAVFLRGVIAHNRKEKAGYQASAEEILNDLPCNPRDIYARGIAQRMGSAARMPIDVMRRKLMPRAVGQVKVDGVHFKGCIYESKDLREWFTRASLKGIFDVAIAYTPNLVDKVIVLDPFDDRKEHIVSLTTTSADFAGYSFAEVMFVQQAKGTKARAAEKYNEAQDVARLQDIRNVTRPAVAEMKVATRGVTPGVRLSGGDEVRAVEAQQRRRDIHDMDKPGLHYGALGADSDVLTVPAGVGAAGAGGGLGAGAGAGGTGGTGGEAVAEAVVLHASPADQPIDAESPSDADINSDSSSASDSDSDDDTDPDLMAALNDILNPQ